ncbi:hypothetical protein F2P56_030715 [Juglans regia]|uniref:Uncharacterized protein n=1 Tax=Juglans regia TaxID=51240 RepID=A0A833X8J0_JUGRE|nr:hypothetical protein F2P56_030715 [Juglans regia]
MTNVTEDIYNKMVEKLNVMDLEARTKEAAAVVFKEVMGKSLGYVRDLGGTVVLETSGTKGNGESASALSHDAQFYKDQLEALKANVQGILLKQDEFEKFMRYSMSQQQSEGESPRETQFAA